LKGFAIDYPIGPIKSMIIGTNYLFVIIGEIRVVIEIGGGLMIPLIQFSE
jgi:hypothetical protein